MDDRLERLRRDHEGSPGDVELARRYEAALLRAGEREAARDLYRFKLRCPLSFVDDLELPSPWSPFARYCEQCEKHVQYVKTADELRDRVAEGSCVAVDPELLQAGDVLIEDANVHPAQEPVRPFCLLEVEESSIPPAPAPQPLMGLLIAPPDYGPPSAPEPAPEPVDEPTPAPSFLQRALGMLRRG